MTAIEKYLSLYSEPESQLLDGFPSDFEQGLVIPVYRESPEIIDRFGYFSRCNPGTLIIMVVNRPDTGFTKNESPVTEFPENGLRAEKTHTQWCEDFIGVLPKHKIIWSANASQLTLYALQSNSGLLVVDRCLTGAPIPVDQGVGLARKIGNDILCSLIDCNKVKSPWMSNTDADVRLPTTYFEAQRLANVSDAALIYPFKHIFIDSTPKIPTLLYEYSLHYYVAGLAWAGSPYAYHTIGSTLTVNYKHYCKVRGFPKRPAAEDFYLLNKLKKTGVITSLDKPSIDIQARESTRVPFGTGPAVRKIGALSNACTMQLYHPDSFIYLHYFLQLMTKLSEHQTSVSEACSALKIDRSITISGATTAAELVSDKLLYEMASMLNLEKAIDHCYKNGNSASKRLKHLNDWFDGFKTLKLIHHLRDHSLGTISFRQLTEEYENSTISIRSKELNASAAKIAAENLSA